MRYSFITPDADVATIDSELDRLREMREGARFPIIRAWITADIDELLEMRRMEP